MGRIPEEVREKTYRSRKDATPVRRPGKKKVRWRDDPGGVGFELVSQLKACPSCYAEWVSRLDSDQEGEAA